MAKINFKEKHRYDDKPVLILLGIFGTAAAVSGVQFLLQNQQNYLRASVALATAIALGGLIWWLRSLRLKVSVSEKNIKYKLSPLHDKKRSVAWKDVEKCEIVKTPEIAQWSGGNISFNREKRISLTGRNGLALQTKEGENLFIGVKNVDELEKTLERIDFA